MPRSLAILWTAGLLVMAGEALSQPASCPAGPATLAGASDAIVRAKPVAAALEQRADMIHLRGTYDVVDRARGAETIDRVIVEFTCIDMPNPTTGGPDLGHCPGGEGIGLTGFIVEGGVAAPSAATVPLFLSAPSRSTLDEAMVFGDVTRRPFQTCGDAPRTFDSAEAEWSHIVAAERVSKPSSPLAEYDAKVSRKEADGGGCR